MWGKKQKQEEAENQKQLNNQPKEHRMLRKRTIKELISPAGIDVRDISNLKIISNTTRYARSFYVSVLPRMCTFPEIFRDMYLFGDVNTSIYINPIAESNHKMN